jgi:hypothetical protein
MMIHIECLNLFMHSILIIFIDLFLTYIIVILLTNLCSFDWVDSWLIQLKSLWNKLCAEVAINWWHAITLWGRMRNPYWRKVDTLLMDGILLMGFYFILLFIFVKDMGIYKVSEQILKARILWFSLLFFL